MAGNARPVWVSNFESRAPAATATDCFAARRRFFARIRMAGDRAGRSVKLKLHFGLGERAPLAGRNVRAADQRTQQ